MNTPSSEWRLTATSEREFALSGRTKRLRRRANGFFMGFAIAFTVFTSFEEGGFSLGSSQDFSLLYFVARLSALPLLGVALYLRRQAKRAVVLARRRREIRQEEFGHIPGWTVDLTVLQGSTPTGRDHGVVWFEDDRLYFVGERTSFGIDRRQALGVQNVTWWVPNLRPRFLVNLHAKTPAGHVAVGIDMTPPVEALSTYRSSDSLLQALQGWIASKKWDEQGEREEGQLPPLTLGPEAPTEHQLLRAALWNSIGWGVILLFLIVLAVLSEGGSVFLPTAGMLWICLIGLGDIWYPRLRWRAWLDRRRLIARP